MTDCDGRPLSNPANSSKAHSLNGAIHRMENLTGVPFGQSAKTCLPLVSLLVSTLTARELEISQGKTDHLNAHSVKVRAFYA